MFELTQEEFQYLRSQFGTSNWGGSRYVPMAFTEVETGQIQQGESISLIFQLLEEMEKEKEKRLEHQSRKKVGVKRPDEQ